MNLSAKGGGTTTDRNSFEVACLGLMSAINIHRHPLGIAKGGARFGLDEGIESAATASGRAAGPAGETQAAPFDEEVYGL
jgi:hypothetical protein